MKQKFSIIMILIVTLAQTAVFAGPQDKKKRADIVDTAIAAGSFNTLVAAVKAAGLVETLKGDGPFTVFAPTDDAFAQLPAGTVESLLKPENREKLAEILTYHVVPGKVTAAQVVNLDRANTVAGSAVRIRVENGSVFVNDAKVVQTDILTRNGVIHVIDRVLLPGSGDSPEAAAGLIERAIQRGVPLYNNGQPAACAAIYEITALALLNLSADLPQPAERSLRTALRKIQHSGDTSEKAWVLRHGLDEAYAALKQGMMSEL